MVNSDEECAFSEPDISDDDMGIGLAGETREEIERIQSGAGPSADPAGASNGPADVVVETPAYDLGQKRPKKTTSQWWAHFTKGDFNKENGSYTATCIYCGFVITQGNQKGTGTLKSHIQRGCKKIPREKRFKPDAMQRMLNAGTKSGEGDVLWEFSQSRSRKGLARMVIAHGYPFNCVNHYFLRVFLKDLQPSFIIPSRNTLRSDCIKVYQEEHDILYDVLGKLDCKISFTSDLWTCKGKDRGFISLTCHFIDEKWQLRKRIINFSYFPSPHTGKTISQAIYAKLVTWNLDKRVFSLVLDNASSNDACIKELLSTSTFKRCLPVDGNLFHQRCGCHILNLIVGDGLAVLENEIKNVRGTMKYLRSSQARMEKFTLACTQAEVTRKKPAWDVPTRWNSTYLMLELALELKEAILRYASIDKSFLFYPTEQEWENVQNLIEYLKVFYVATNKLSGTKYPTLNLFFPEFCEVFLSLRKMASSPVEFVVAMGSDMFSKWDKYWSSGNCLLALACVLDPRCKMAVVEYYYGEMNPEDASRFMVTLKQCLEALFNEYSNEVTSGNGSSRSSTHNSRSISQPVTMSDTRAGLNSFLNSKKIAEPAISELEAYLAEPLDPAGMEDDFDILAWWKLKAPKYPIMAKLTRDILAVPISTVASEATFSIAGRVLSPVRSSLSDDSIEALICAQDWLRASVVEAGGVFGDVCWSTDEAAFVGDDTICGT